MNQPLSYAVLRKENQTFAGSGGVSQENRARGFIPAFYDTQSGKAGVSRFRNGTPAPIHNIRRGSRRVDRGTQSIWPGHRRQGFRGRGLPASGPILHPHPSCPGTPPLIV